MNEREFRDFKLKAKLTMHYHSNYEGTHWLSHHLQQFPPENEFADNLLSALLACENRIPALGFTLIREIAQVKFVRGDPASYEQLIQKLAEVLALRVALDIDWPENTIFSHEPEAPNGKRPELYIETKNEVFIIEVKCPRLIEHKERRSKDSGQLAARFMPKEQSQEILSSMFGDKATLPKDNQIKDFLVSANEKFISFKSDKPTFGLLVLIWDNLLYEVISPLTHGVCGLLTENTWFKNSNEEPERFSSVDGVLVLNHFDVLTSSTRGEAKLHRADTFNLDRRETAYTNIWCQNSVGKEIPTYFLEAFDATPQDHVEGIITELSAVEMVMWLGKEND